MRSGFAAEEGYRVFDFGITDRQQTGLRRFKSKWGAQRKRGFYSYLLGEPDNEERIFTGR